MTTTEKILIVEDDSIERFGLLDSFSSEFPREKYQIDSAANGQQAWNYLDKQKRGLELIVLDLAIPAPDGYQILERIESDPISTRVLVVSCHSQRHNVEKVIGLGIHGFIEKPVDDLDTVIEQTKKILTEPKFNRFTRKARKITPRQILKSINQLSANDRLEIVREIIDLLSIKKQTLLGEYVKELKLQAQFDRPSPDFDPLDLDFDDPNTLKRPDIIDICKYKYGTASLDLTNPKPVLKYKKGSQSRSKVLDPDHPAVIKYLQKNNLPPLPTKEEKKKDETGHKIKNLIDSEEKALEVLQAILAKYPEILQRLDLHSLDPEKSNKGSKKIKLY